MKTRAQSLIRVTAGCLGLSMGVFAADVVIHPGNGVETNVAAISAASAVRVNPGANGGGIVHLNAQNAYSATTTLGCGTLVADRVAAAGTASSLGKSGLVAIGAGTFRYDGPDGGWTDRTFTNDTPVNTQAAIYDIRHDLTLASDLVQARGSFVKTGPGTLHLAGTGTTRLNQAGVLRDSAEGFQCRFVPNANGDSPTAGYRGFHVLEADDRHVPEALEHLHYKVAGLVLQESLEARGIGLPLHEDVPVRRRLEHVARRRIRELMAALGPEVDRHAPVEVVHRPDLPKPPRLAEHQGARLAGLLGHEVDQLLQPHKRLRKRPRAEVRAVDERKQKPVPGGLLQGVANLRRRHAFRQLHLILAHKAERTREILRLCAAAQLVRQLLRIGHLSLHLGN